MQGPSPLQALPALKPGQRIGVIAPSGPLAPGRLAKALSALSGDHPLQLAPNLERKERFLAGSDGERIEGVNAALRDPDVRCIWALRGGYGASRIVAHLDIDAFRRDPKPIVGFSDITVLLSWAASAGYRSIHGPVATQLPELPAAQQRWVFDLLYGKAQPVLPFDFDQKGGAKEGTLIGGNLSLCSHLCGTPWALSFDDALAFFEDVGERPYAIDRYFGQLDAQQAEMSPRRAKGILFGEFTRCGEPGSDDQSSDEVCREWAERAGQSYGRELPFGHGMSNWALPFGARARMEKGKLFLLEGAIEA